MSTKTKTKTSSKQPKNANHPDYILNPQSGIWVKRNGAIGKRLLAAQKDDEKFKPEKVPPTIKDTKRTVKDIRLEIQKHELAIAELEKEIRMLKLEPTKAKLVKLFGFDTKAFSEAQDIIISEDAEGFTDAETVTKKIKLVYGDGENIIVKLTLPDEEEGHITFDSLHKGKDMIREYFEIGKGSDIDRMFEHYPAWKKIPRFADLAQGISNIQDIPDFVQVAVEDI